MFDEEIVEINKRTPGRDDPIKTAESIARAASDLSQQWFRTSPFAKAAQQHGHPFVFGGKMDDITVVVAVVAPTTNNSDPTPLTTTTPTTAITPTDTETNAHDSQSQTPPPTN